MKTVFQLFIVPTIITFLILVCLDGCMAYGQMPDLYPSAYTTNSISPASSSAVQNPYRQLGTDLWNIVKPIAPDRNDAYVLSVGYGKNTASRETLVAGMLSIVNTNDTGVSIVGGRIGSRWEYGGGTFSLGRTDIVPIFGKITESIGDGVIYDWQTHDPANYAFARVTKDWKVYRYINAGPGFLIDHRSNASGVDWFVGLHLGGTF